MNYKIKHVTHYKYIGEASICHSKVWLTPKNLFYQQCDNFRLEIEPKPKELHEHTDSFGNKTIYFELHSTHRQLKVTALSTVRRQLPPAPDTSLFGQEMCFENIGNYIQEDLEIRQYLVPSPYIVFLPELREYGLSSFEPGKPLLQSIKELNSRIFKDFKFVSGFTNINTPIKTVFKERKGVCQDFSHLMISCLRSIGIPTRYVSGYLETLPPPGKKKLKGADASHAWVSSYIPEIGWVDFDPTNNMSPGDRHVTVAWGRDYADVPPVKGIIFSGGGHDLKVSVDMEAGEAI